MERLPRPAPDRPLPLARQWLADADSSGAINPRAMALSTVSAEGRPSVRFVLLKDLSEADAFIVFYTNYGSRKAAELDAAKTAAGAMYWPDAGRQIRFEGRVERSPDTESDAYFASRPRMSQLNAWASNQSQPIASPDLMADQLDAMQQRFGAESAVPRPEHWGGYRLYVDVVELWVAGDDRFHERLRYCRESDGSWTSVWLQP